MTVSELPKDELQETLNGLRRLLDATEKELRAKKAKYDELSQQLSGLSSSERNLRGSISAVERALGLPADEPVPTVSATPNADSEEQLDATKSAMRIVAKHHESGGITFDEILKALRDQGIEITREYMHTILNRKKNHQKKLVKVSGKWFLTDKGKIEVGMSLS